MILLCVFFIMMVSVSKIDMGSFERVRSALQGHTQNTLVELSDRLEEMVTEEAGISGVEVGIGREGVRLDFEAAALFDSGSAVLKTGALDGMLPIFEIISTTRYRIDVEGHSDDVPLHRKSGDELETNWSLSGRRASSVVHRLQELGFPPSRLRIVGYAATRPKVPIDGLSEEALDRARAENRRVSILIR
ncbi:MAG: OmpA family protein [Myxococcales bacterium]|nr:OmpA family protein [Myxococcales bacterium]